MGKSLEISTPLEEIIESCWKEIESQQHILSMANSTVQRTYYRNLHVAIEKMNRVGTTLSVALRKVNSLETGSSFDQTKDDQRHRGLAISFLNSLKRDTAHCQSLLDELNEDVRASDRERFGKEFS